MASSLYNVVNVHAVDCENATDNQSPPCTAVPVVVLVPIPMQVYQYVPVMTAAPVELPAKADSCNSITSCTTAMTKINSLASSATAVTSSPDSRKANTGTHRDGFTAHIPFGDVDDDWSTLAQIPFGDVDDDCLSSNASCSDGLQDYLECSNSRQQHKPGCRPCWNHIKGTCMRGTDCLYCHAPVHRIRRKQSRYQRWKVAVGNKVAANMPAPIAAQQGVTNGQHGTVRRIHDDDSIEVEWDSGSVTDVTKFWLQSPRRRQPCHKFLRGECLRGAQCSYRHDLRAVSNQSRSQSAPDRKSHLKTSELDVMKLMDK